MQFSTVAIFAASAVAASAATLTETDSSSTLVTITSCGPTVTNCPAKHNSTAAVSTYAGAGAKNAAYGVAALAAGAVLAL